MTFYDRKKLLEISETKTDAEICKHYTKEYLQIKTGLTILTSLENSGRFIEQKFMLSWTLRCDQIHKHLYDLGRSLLWCLSPT